MSEKKYHALNIINTNTGSEKNALLADCLGIELLFESLRENERIEFSGVMRFNPNKIDLDDEDFFNEAGMVVSGLGKQLNDDDIIELTNIKKVIL